MCDGLVSCRDGSDEICCGNHDEWLKNNRQNIFWNYISRKETCNSLNIDFSSLNDVNFFYNTLTGNYTGPECQRGNWNIAWFYHCGM